MCERYAASRKPEELVELFQVSTWEPTETLAPNGNVAPTAEVYPVTMAVNNVRNKGPELLEPLPALEEETLFR